ncbi:hypothetical protein DM02DRAFT_611682 [Periconia macrospinosa]|uniref:Uncharacterized protein n=1 Tax=Periconia macrospinosa TaxID=97972 RepID=A0A2V1E4D6_9PLEO|nr:hypothetical protein DM02DRAFT_611682 [Periconia macrospinosa]
MSNGDCYEAGPSVSRKDETSDTSSNTEQPVAITGLASKWPSYDPERFWQLLSSDANAQKGRRFLLAETSERTFRTPKVLRTLRTPTSYVQPLLSLFQDREKHGFGSVRLICPLEIPDQVDQVDQLEEFDAGMLLQQINETLERIQNSQSCENTAIPMNQPKSLKAMPVDGRDTTLFQLEMKMPYIPLNTLNEWKRHGSERPGVIHCKDWINLDDNSLKLDDEVGLPEEGYRMQYPGSAKPSRRVSHVHTNECRSCGSLYVWNTITALTCAVCAYTMSNYADLRRHYDHPYQNIGPPPGLASFLTRPSPTMFVAVTIGHGVSAYWYYSARSEDRFREWFVAVGAIGGTLGGLMTGANAQDILVGILPVLLIASLVICTGVNSLWYCCECCDRRKVSGSGDDWC